MYNVEEFDEDGYGQEEDEVYDHHDDEITPESEAFTTHHLSDLGSTIPSNLPRFRNKKNPFWNFYTDANITLYAAQTYNGILEEEKYDEDNKKREEEEDDYDVDNEFFVPHGYLSDEEEERMKIKYLK